MTLAARLREAARQYPELGPLLVDAAQRIEAQQRELRRVATFQRLDPDDEVVIRLARFMEHLPTD